MALGIQGSLFEEATDAIVVGDFTGITRRVLSDGAWVDVLPGWIGGAAHLFDDLHRDAAWRAERRQMYDRIVDVPRLIATYREHDRLPHHAVGDAMQALSDHYRPDLPEGFATAGLALYRDGNDSVAWHGDRFGRGATDDTMVAILSLGAPRQLLLRPRPTDDAHGADTTSPTTLRFTLSSGDLLVMGGSCQRTWEHAVPKVRAAGLRMSVQFRPPGVW